MGVLDEIQLQIQVAEQAARSSESGSAGASDQAS